MLEWGFHYTNMRIVPATQLWGLQCCKSMRRCDRSIASAMYAAHLTNIFPWHVSYHIGYNLDLPHTVWPLFPTPPCHLHYWPEWHLPTRASCSSFSIRVIATKALNRRAYILLSKLHSAKRRVVCCLQEKLESWAWKCACCFTLWPLDYMQKQSFSTFFSQFLFNYAKTHSLYALSLLDAISF